jgi:hypothetical protein
MTCRVAFEKTWLKRSSSNCRFLTGLTSAGQKKDVQKIADELLITREQTASEARRFCEVSELKEEVIVPEDLYAKLEKLRRKRAW